MWLALVKAERVARTGLKSIDWTRPPVQLSFEGAHVDERSLVAKDATAGALLGRLENAHGVLGAGDRHP